MAGLPRAVGFIYWTIVAALTIGMHQLWILPVAMLGHWGLARLTRLTHISWQLSVLACTHTKDQLQRAAMHSDYLLVAILLTFFLLLGFGFFIVARQGMGERKAGAA